MQCYADPFRVSNGLLEHYRDLRRTAATAYELPALRRNNRSRKLLLTRRTLPAKEEPVGSGGTAYGAGLGILESATTRFAAARLMPEPA